MLVCRHQAFVPAPVTRVWELLGHPNRHPEWWPEVVEVQGQQFGPGCSYCRVSRDEEGVSEMTFLVERITEFKELLVRCRETGLYMRWLLTAAQDGTFVDAEFGIDSDMARGNELDPRAARQELRRLLHTSLDGLAGAAALGVPR